MHGLPDAVVLGHASLDRSLSLADVKQGRGTKDLQRLALKRELQRLQEVDPAFLYAFGLTYIKAETRSNKVWRLGLGSAQCSILCVCRGTRTSHMPIHSCTAYFERWYWKAYLHFCRATWGAWPIVNSMFHVTHL